MNKQSGSSITRRPLHDQDARAGSVGPGQLLTLASILVVMFLFYVALTLRMDTPQDSTRTIIRVYCAAGFAQPVEVVIREFNRTHDANVQLARTAGSGELAGQIRTEFETGLSTGADIFISADESLIQTAKLDGVISASTIIAVQKPVIAVSVDQTINLEDLQSLVTRNDMSFGVASANAAIGKLTRDIAKRTGFLEELEQRKRLDAENVMTLAQALVTGSLDAAIVWDTTVMQVNHQYDQPVLKIAALADSLNQSSSHVTVGIVSTTGQPAAAAEFASYLSSGEIGQKYFESLGYKLPRIFEQR